MLVCVPLHTSRSALLHSSACIEPLTLWHHLGSHCGPKPGKLTTPTKRHCSRRLRGISSQNGGLCCPPRFFIVGCPPTHGNLLRIEVHIVMVVGIQRSHSHMVQKHPRSSRRLCRSMALRYHPLTQPTDTQTHPGPLPKTSSPGLEVEC